MEQLSKEKLDNIEPVITYCYFRSPMVKLHASMSLAKAAFKTNMRGYRGAKQNMHLYVMTEKGWQLRYEMKAGDNKLPWEDEDNGV